MKTRILVVITCLGVALAAPSFWAPLAAQLDKKARQQHEEARRDKVAKPKVIKMISPNKNSRGGAKVDTIVLHHTAGGGTAKDVAGFFQNPKAEVSSHYVVDKEGAIVQAVEDKDRAWHAGESEFKGRKDVNDFSIGIEMVNKGDGKDPFTDKQYAAMGKLVAYLQGEYGIPRYRVTGHKDVALPKGRKNDPAPNFNYERLDREIAKARGDGKAEEDGKEPAGGKEIAWGRKVSAKFKEKVIQIAAELKTNPDFLMAAMAFESGESFSPSVPNEAGSGAVGLIQFMPSTAKSLGTSTAALKKMSAVEQLDYVKKYMQPYKGKLSQVDDVYMAILFPAAVGKPAGFALFTKGTTAYTQNAGLDANKDGKVTKAEAAGKVRDMLEKGRRPENKR
jgi:N-acetyl-anhydromuramyl-L-alanine amidase AmpD